MRFVSEAMGMLESFIAAGAREFDVSRTTIDREGIKGGYRPAKTVHQMRELLPYLVQASARDQTNLIIRPRIAYPASLIQLDDLIDAQLERVHPFSFLVIRTSPKSRQAWLRVEGCDWNFIQRVKKAVGSDPRANGWVRVCGTVNYKREYLPDCPMVRLETAQSSPTLTSGCLIELGLVALLEPHPVASRVQVNGHKPKAFPRYEICLNKAPETRRGDKDRSLADFTWCCTAIRWGWTVEEAAARLQEEPLSKAHQRGEAYAKKTAEAAAAVARDRRR